MMTATIIYLKEVATAKKILGFGFCLLALLALFSNVIFGAIFLVLGLNLLSTEGAEIDLDKKTYRTIKSLFGQHFGTWKECPNFEYVSVFRTKEDQTVRVVTAEATYRTNVILLNLFYNGNKHITFYKTQNKEDAFRVASRFKEALKIDILDATEREKKWL